MSGILVLPELQDGVFRKVSFEIATQAIECAKVLGIPTTALVMGQNVQAIAGQLSGYGIARILLVEGEAFAKYDLMLCAKTALGAIQYTGADYVFCPASLLGKSLAAMIAAQLQTSALTDCVSWQVKDNKLVLVRPIYAGKVLAKIVPHSTPVVVSLRPNVFPSIQNPVQPSIEMFAIPNEKTPFTKLVSIERSNSKKIELTEAGIIVAGGRGMKGPEHFHLVEELAEALNGAVGASRAIVDAGWRPHEEQVGQTGKTVSPQLYVACGISGAIQHVAGMRTAKVIVAVNKDKDAPIFQIADYGIVGDTLEVLPKMIEEAKKLAK